MCIQDAKSIKKTPECQEVGTADSFVHKIINLHHADPQHFLTAPYPRKKFPLGNKNLNRIRGPLMWDPGAGMWVLTTIMNELNLWSSDQRVQMSVRSTDSVCVRMIARPTEH